MTMTDNEILEAYIADMTFRNLSPNTINVRRRYWKKFIKEVGIQTATEQKIVQWLGRPSLGVKSRAMWISTLSALYDWANHAHLFTDTEMGDGWNPTTDVPKPRLHARSPRPMEQADLTRALSMADERMRIWLLLGCLAGLRCMEIAGLIRDDVRETQMSLHIIGKGSKERYVPLHPDILEALQAFGMPSEGRLWGDETAASVSRKINRFLHGPVGTTSTAHTLRHFAGTAWYRSCKDLRVVQELMGHSDPSTTAGYAAGDMSQSASVVNGINVL